MGDLYPEMCKRRVQSGGHQCHTRGSLLGNRPSAGRGQRSVLSQPDPPPLPTPQLRLASLAPYLPFFGPLHLTGIQVAVQQLIMEALRVKWGWSGVVAMAPHPFPALPNQAPALPAGRPHG